MHGAVVSDDLVWQVERCVFVGCFNMLAHVDLQPHTVSFTVSAFHDQDDEEELMKELARIKKERAEEAAKKVGQRP